MNNSKHQIIILISTLACLIALTAIQITWLVKAARVQEAQFTHSVTMAMNRFVENLARDKAICKEVTHCMKEGTSGSCFLMMKNREEWANIGKLIKDDLKYYGINLDFEFDIVETGSSEINEKSSSVYFSDDLVKALEQTGLELKIRFPEKRDFILAQIGYIFIFSIALLILVSLSIIMIYGFYKKEKKLTASIVDFVNNMTHEFKTPLTNIALANSMISKTETVEKDQKLTFYSHVIKSEHDKLKQRVEELLMTNFSEAGQPVFSERIEVSGVIENVIEAYSVQIREKGGIILQKIERDGLAVTGNLDLFHIALGNIVDNAIKYCEAPPEIVISVSLWNNSVLIEITDNGIGIEKIHLDQIFNKFYRVPTGDVHDAKGFGLGLYHVNNIINKMGGKIKVTSSLGKGSCFSIKLPAVAVNEKQ